jgi:hypothetical protein
MVIMVKVQALSLTPALTWIKPLKLVFTCGAPPQRAHGLVGHGDAPVLSEGCEPHLKTGRPPRYRVACVARRSQLPRAV